MARKAYTSSARTTSERIWSTDVTHTRGRRDSCGCMSRDKATSQKGKRTRFWITKCSRKRYISCLDLCFILDLVYNLTESTDMSIPFSFDSCPFNKFVDFTIGVGFGLHQMAFTNHNGRHEGKRETATNGVDVCLTANTDGHLCWIRMG